MFFVRSQLLLISNFQIFDVRSKIVQNIKFLSVSQNNNLISKLDFTHQHESKGMLGLQNKALDAKLLQFHTNQDYLAYLEKYIFNESSFAKFETTIGFVALKRVQEWSRFLTLSPS